MKRVRIDDPRMPTMDDDLQTLIAKSQAAFARKRNMAPRMAEMRDQTPPPRAQRQDKPIRNGLMQRPNRG